MTLIPLISAIMTAPEATTAPAGAAVPLPRNSYGSDARHHPVAALFAVGLPAALVLAVALSPMIVEMVPKSEPMTGTLIELEKPLDPPPPKQADDVEPMPRAASTPDVIDPVVPTTSLTEPWADTGPSIPDVGPVDPGPPARAADPPTIPKLVLAQLDQRYADLFQPDYPARAQREGIEGVAVVRVLIGTDGRVKAVELVSADDAAFFEATKRRALAKWRFKPATRGGVAEESWKEMRVRFEIKNA
ncbi:energy transducer TonB [Sphingopyxis sp. H038]|uniref:energy transducer TonB n=1 Tax=unclassified Sphingopyxis TaxID=2614943 RepID=UPI0007306381|nr:MULTISPECIES: energy transducer TonB [unclassified Sphingopyxis]KTD99844.1 energy transducer TonB [Sphingopyxis sp. H012]KTE05593.1 energy transducer TonB [Sphingopyxis sp. H093]KTE06929.1 energy transducer TonB [Sphingopyxis sp. H053]KTE23090.1 energy transducer TonB [Sphingopyxis sp. H080]KTE32123.1 energy transducer TonB [Sphingopyxis sp. H038]